MKKDKTEQFPKDLKDEITSYLDEVRADMDHYLAWAAEEVRGTGDVQHASEIIEDAIHRLLLISYYLATFFEDTEPSQLLADLTSQVAEEQAKEEAERQGKLIHADPQNRTKH